MKNTNQVHMPPDNHYLHSADIDYSHYDTHNTNDHDDIESQHPGVQAVHAVSEINTSMQPKHKEAFSDQANLAAGRKHGSHFLKSTPQLEALQNSTLN